jgi:hypothetical protein
MSGNNLIDRAERWPVDLRGFALSDTRDSDISVSELSYGGCKLSCEEPFSEGELVELRIIKRGAVQAEIRWFDDGRAGARFVK